MQVLKRHSLREQTEGRLACLQRRGPASLPAWRVCSNCWLAAWSGGGAAEVACFANFWFPFPVWSVSGSLVGWVTSYRRKYNIAAAEG